MARAGPRSWPPLLALAATAPATAAGAAISLPPAPHSIELPSELDLRLELVVNGLATGRIVPIIERGTHVIVPVEALRSAGIRLDPDMAGSVDLTRIVGVETHCDQQTQRLLLRVPDDWLPQQRVGSSGGDHIRPESSFGALFNYDLYVASGNSGTAYASLWNEARLFGSFGVVRNTGTYRIDLAGSRAGNGGDRYTRYDTNWTYVDDERVRTYEAGDFVTRTLAWSNPARLGGIQVSRDFSVRPDIITYPLPTFSGTASVPTAVDLFVNGYKAASASLQPGPYTLSNIPYINGAGEAVVQTTDAQGRRVSASIPFYVASTLLRQGLSDYAFSIGMVRQDYGARSFSYGAAAASGAWRYGLTSRLTLEAQTQFARAMQSAGLGGVLRIGQIGVFNASAAISRHDDGTGSQIMLGYQYQDRHFNLSASQTFRSKDFTDLGGYGVSDYRLPTRQTQVSADMVYDRVGTIGISYIATKQQDERYRLVNLSYFRSLGHEISLSVSVGRDFEHRATTGMAHITMPLGRAGTAVAGVERDTDGATREHVGYNRAVPTSGGLGWSLSAARGSHDVDQYQAGVTWRLPVIQAQAGVFGGQGDQTRWGDLSGSIVLMDGGAFAANRVNDAFALVSTDHVANVPVRYENQQIGVTDRHGHLLVPWATSYYGAKYEIDPLDLPEDISTPVVEQRAAIRLGSGRLIRFPVKRIMAASVVLQDRTGSLLKPGTLITLDTGAVSYVGWDGAVYLEGLKAMNRVTATLPDNSSCSLAFPFDAGRHGIARIGPLTCQ